MTDRQRRPLPVPTPVSEPYWEGLRREEVRIQHCDRCQTWVFYPRSHCPRCLDPELDWRTVSGRARLHSFTVSRPPTSGLAEEQVPELLAIVELDEGPRLTTTLVDADHAAVTVGVRVEPVFDHVDEQHTLLRYRLA